MRHFFSFFSLLLLMSCAHQTQEYIDSSLQPWMGQHPDRLVEAWGAPSGTYTLADGRKVLSYNHEFNESQSIYRGRYFRSDFISTTGRCKISFFTDKDQQTLASYTHAGDLSACSDLLRSSPTLPKKG